MQLYRIKELADLFVDACVRDNEGNLVFLSVFGRDGSVLQMLASFSQPAMEGGLRSFTLVDPISEQEQVVRLGDVARLQKYTGKLPKSMLFASMVHTWLYDPSIVKPDRSNQTGWILLQETDALVYAEAIWILVKLLSPVPLLDAWQASLLSGMPELVVDLSSSNYPPIGRVRASRVTLPKSFTTFVSERVKDGTLALNPA